MALNDLEFGQIVSIMRQRINQDAELLKYMVEIRDRYNGDIVIPLPDVEGQKPMDPPTPRLIQDAIDHTAMRANSTLPRIDVPALVLGPRGQKQADTVRRALNGKWYETQLQLKLYRAYRHYVGYGAMSFVVFPDDQDQSARIDLRDPLTTYPELRSPDDIRQPKNVGYIFGRSSAWIHEHYPEAWEMVISPSAAAEWDTLWDMVEWIDEERVVIGLMGPRFPAYAPQENKPYGYSGYEIKRWENKAGMVTAVCPRRLTLDKILGQVTTLIKTTDLYARLTALDIAATEKAIFPDIAIISKGQGPPQLIDGVWKDGRTGDVNRLTESVVQILNSSPGPMTAPMLDRLDQAIRDSGGIPELYSGGGGGMRTGQGISEAGAFSVDPRIQEAQAYMARCLSFVNDSVMATERAYYPRKKFYYFAGLPGVDESGTYIPAEDFDPKIKNIVAYPFPGSDISQVSVALAQLAGADLLSKRTARRKHPFVDDADQEEKNITIETLEEAVLDGMAQQAASGQLDLSLAMSALKKIRNGQELVDAFEQAKNEAAEQQAQQQQQQSPGAVEPGGPSSPPGAPAPGGPQQPGAGGPGGQVPPGIQAMLANAGMAGQGGGPAPAVPPPSPSMINVRHMTQALDANISPNAV